MDVKAEIYRDLYFERYRDLPHPSYQRRGSLQLWQFLVTLLDDPSNSSFIAWTGRGLEFKLIEPEEVSSSLFHSFDTETNRRGEADCLQKTVDLPYLLFHLKLLKLI